MKSNLLALLVVVGLFACLQMVLGAPKPETRMRKSLRKSNAARRIPFGPGPMMPRPQPFSRPQFPAQAKRNSNPAKRSPFWASLLNLPNFDTFNTQPTWPSSMDPTTMPTSLDEAFKMGYQAGKSVAFGDSIRNQYKYPCAQDDGDCRGSYTYNVYMMTPSYPSTDSGYLNYIPFDPTFGGVYPQVNEDDDLIPAPVYIGIDPGYSYTGDIIGVIPIDAASAVPIDQPAVVSVPVLVGDDGSVTALATDAAGNVIVNPDGTVAAAPTDAAGNVLVGVDVNGDSIADQAVPVTVLTDVPAPVIV